MSKENKDKNQNYSGNSIASYWLSGTRLGNLLGYGNNTYTDGYGVERQNPSLQEGAQGQQLSRMKDTAKNYGKLTLVGASFGNPLAARTTWGAALNTGAQSYFMTEGLQDAYNRFMKKDKNAGDALWAGLDLAGAVPAVGSLYMGLKRLNFNFPTKQANIPLKSRSLLDGTNSEVQFSVDNWNQAVRSGINKAREFLNSETKAKTFERNNRLFKSIYNSDLPKSNFDVNSPVQIKTVPLKNWNPGNFDYKGDVINLNSNLVGSDYAAFHEYLHRNRYADSLDPVFFSDTPQKVRFNADDFYTSIATKTLNKDYFKIDPDKYEYLMDANELATNALELGVREGLTFGQKYPGVQGATKVFERLEQNPSKGFVMQAIDWRSQPRRAWRAITGTLFGTTPLLFIQNQEENELNNKQ